MLKRGFITIATGNERYYRLAHNLLISYKFHAKHPLPWAIICDKENDVTRSFDVVVILDTPTRSYMDKIEMLQVLPFEENIYIDADSLCYDDINNFFDYFPLNGVKCFGSTFPLSDKIHGWFTVDDIGEWGSKVDVVINTHGGIMFLNNDVLTKKIYCTCKQIEKEYSSYKFKMFPSPADEPIIALSMAVHRSYPIQLQGFKLFTTYVFWNGIRLKTNILKKQCSYTRNGKTWRHNVQLLHYGNWHTELLRYRIEVNRLLNKNQLYMFWDTCCYYLSKKGLITCYLKVVRAGKRLIGKI